MTAQALYRKEIKNIKLPPNYLKRKETFVASNFIHGLTEQRHDVKQFCDNPIIVLIIDNCHYDGCFNLEGGEAIVMKSLREAFQTKKRRDFGPGGPHLMRIHKT